MSQNPRISHVVGARPNFIKAAPVIEALGLHGVEQDIIHTGQHYDSMMSDVFFQDLGIPEPRINLGVGSASHAQQTAALMVGMEKALLNLAPDALVIYGDVNSTLAAALVASKLGIATVHIEAGLRSFDMTMPEELNRIVTDQLSDLLLTTSPEACAHLGREGRDAEHIRLVGNTMIDTLLAHRMRFDSDAVRVRLGLPADWALVTMHRPGNVDDPERAHALVDALVSLSSSIDLVIPLHPRSRKTLSALGLESSERIHVIEPLGYLEFMSLTQGAQLVVTDSGGVQEETTILDVPCLTIRPNTERPITITHGTNQLITIDGLIPAAIEILSGKKSFPKARPPLWDGSAGPRCAEEILNFLRSRERVS